MSRFTKYLLVTMAVILGLFLAWLAYFAVTPLKLKPQSQSIKIQENSSLRGIANQLVTQGVITESWRFIILASLLHKESSLQSGTYILNKNITPYHLLLSLNHGKTTQSAITFIEGHTFAQMRERLAKNDAIKHTVNNMSDKQIMLMLGAKDECLYPEGCFFPDTYYFNRGIEDKVILQRAFNAMKSRLSRAWSGRALSYNGKSLPYKSPYEALIMASIIEKETGRSADRTMISSVFVNRLNVGMRLQTDPSVIYGARKHYAGNISRKDLETDTAYNSYTRVGLPPTPIAMPSLASIEAALHPEESKALYFVGDGDASYFSESLEEHNRAVSKYILRKPG